MPDDVFEVGDRVFLTTTKQLGTIVKVTIQRPSNEPDETDGVGKRLYDIELDTGRTIKGVYHGIERAQR